MKPEPRDCYVYLYRLPNGMPVYVGSGRKRRDHESVWDANTLNAGKRSQIGAPRWIVFLAKQLRKGIVPTIERLEEGLDRWAALLLEADYIAAFGRRGIDNGGTLLNVLSMGGRYIGMTSEDSKRCHSDPLYLAELSERMTAKHAEPEFRDKWYPALLAAVSEPNYAKKNAARNGARARAQVNDPSWQAKQKAGCEKLSKDKAHLECVREAANREDRRRKISEAKKAWWVKRRADPAAYALTIGKIATASRNRPKEDHWAHDPVRRAAIGAKISATQQTDEFKKRKHDALCAAWARRRG